MQRVLVLGAILVGGMLATVVSALHAARGGPDEGQPAPSAAAIQVDRLADTLYVLRGGGGNTAAFLTATGIVLVDTKLPGWGQPLIEKLKEITDKPVTTIINTHTHFDHLGGNVDFPASVAVVAQENTATLMQDMRPVTGGPPQPAVCKDSSGRGLATRIFKDRLTLGSGRERIDLYYFGRAHTGGDAWIVFPALRAMHTGDAFAGKGIPIMDANNGGSGVEYPATLEKAAAVPDIDTLITGHAQTTQTLADLRVHAQFIREFVETVQAAKRAGRTIDDVVNAWRMPERLLQAGYMTEEEYQKLARQPMRARIRANAEVVWAETK